MPTTDQPVAFASGDLTLEGLLHLSDGHDRSPGVVVCHPHPRHGGDMNNNVVVAVADSLCRAGIAALRFNFRGVGRSEGAFDKGQGEVQDAREAAGYLELHERIDPTRVGIVGYSFGAWMALEAACDHGAIQAVASIACPVQPFSRLGVGEHVQPRLLLCGDLDHDFPAQQFKFLAQRFSGTKEVELISEADHFFRGKLDSLTAVIEAHLKANATFG